MSNLVRTASRAWAPALIILLLILGSVAPPALAQSGQTGSQAGEESELTKKEQKEKAKQARIEEYLRKKEERRARRELEQEQKAQAAAQAEAAEAGGSSAGAAAVAVGATAAAGAKKKSQQPTDGDEIVLPKGLREAQEILRGNEIAKDPTVAEYMDLIDRAEASPRQLAAFGNFLSQNGANRLALEYYAAALSIEQEDPVIWLNVGTLHRQLQQYPDAVSAYARALRLDPNNAFAHYNLGAVFDEQGKYDDALEEYRIALTLDPTLGDPELNPQAANNERLLAVKLMIYQQQIGNLGLPLVEVPGGELAAPAPKED
jgi:tetratricopeptide (TPR) repeat protein